MPLAKVEKNDFQIPKGAPKQGGSTLVTPVKPGPAKAPPNAPKNPKTPEDWFDAGKVQPMILHAINTLPGTAPATYPPTASISKTDPEDLFETIFGQDNEETELDEVPAAKKFQYFQSDVNGLVQGGKNPKLPLDPYLGAQNEDSEPPINTEVDDLTASFAKTGVGSSSGGPQTPGTPSPAGGNPTDPQTPTKKKPGKTKQLINKIQNTLGNKKKKPPPSGGGAAGGGATVVLSS